MADASVTRLGQDGLAGVTDALFLKVFSGEVLAAFEERNVMMPLHNVRTITSGKSAQFPVFGKAIAKYHTPGEDIIDDGSELIGMTERTVAIDQLLLSKVFIANIDEAMAHYDVRSIYSRELGFALANHADEACIRTVIAGAQSALTDPNPVEQGSTGKEGARLDTGTTGDGVIDQIIEAARLMDEASVPADDRYCLLTPEYYYKVVASAGSSNTAGAVMNRDFDGSGSISTGRFTNVAGVNVMMSNHIPTSNEDSGAATVFESTSIANDIYAGSGVGYGGLNFTNTNGVVFQRTGLATVKLLDLALETEYSVRNQGTLMVAKYAMGHNFLRPECCYHLRTASP
mgnify:FL=1|tara:strand:- start:6066 stop:7097 length:1032 start_codon:yes stop_codon:yes gene_type:complete